MSTLLAACCCTVAGDPCDTDWNFFDCCSGRRIFDHPVFDLPPYLQESLGVQVALTRSPPGPFLTDVGNYKVKIDSIPAAMSCVGGRLNYGENYPNNYDYFGAKAGNWGPPTGSGNIFVRESLLRAYGEQFPNAWQAVGFERYANTSVDSILNGNGTLIETGTFDRLQMYMRGPSACQSTGCAKIANGAIELSSSSSFNPVFGVNWVLYRGTERDGGLDSSCNPVDGTWPDFCAQCPQELSALTGAVAVDSLWSTYVKGNACGIPADIQALIEAGNPGQISDAWFLRAKYCSGGTHYFGGCTQGWYESTCEEQTNSQSGTTFAEYGECSCCSDGYDSQEVSVQVIT